jgi:hypothetical protein
MAAAGHPQTKLLLLTRRTRKPTNNVIRITTQPGEHLTVVTIDGQIGESDLKEIRKVRKAVHGGVALSLRGVDACAATGIQVLRDWLGAGAELQDATPFLEMVLKEH